MSCAQLHHHGRSVHAHPHPGPHRHFPRLPLRSHEHTHPAHDHDHDHDPRSHDDAGHTHRDHGHSHGLVDPAIKRSREGIRAVGWSLAVLGATALAQIIVYLSSGSVALLADLIHNAGDALTAVPLAIAFMLHSERAERGAGLFVVATIFVSACVAGVESIHRLLSPAPPSHLVALAVAGAVGFVGNRIAARIRTRAGRQLDSPALVADGNHARADAYVSAAVILSAGALAAGFSLADPLIGLAITAVILRITFHSWRTVRGNIV